MMIMILIISKVTEKSWKERNQLHIAHAMHKCFRLCTAGFNAPKLLVDGMEIFVKHLF